MCCAVRPLAIGLATKRNTCPNSFDQTELPNLRISPLTLLSLASLRDPRKLGQAYHLCAVGGEPSRWRGKMRIGPCVHTETTRHESSRRGDGCCVIDIDGDGWGVGAVDVILG